MWSYTSIICARFSWEFWVRSIKILKIQNYGEKKTDKFQIWNQSKTIEARRFILCYVGNL